MLTGAEETARHFGFWGEMVAGVIALGAAATVKILNDRRWQNHLQAEHNAESPKKIQASLSQPLAAERLFAD